MQEILKPTGLVTIVHKNAAGEILNEQQVKNLVVTTGKNHIASRIGSVSQPTAMSHMAIGTGTTAPNATDTQLGTEAGRVALSATVVSTNTVQYTATFLAGTGTGAVTEAGVFNAGGSGSGTMLCRTTFSAVNKASGDSIAITWVVTVS